MKKQLIIMDFTGVYNYEPFIRNQNCIWLDCVICMGRNAIVMKKELLLSND